MEKKPAGIEELYVALGVIAGLKSETVEQRFYAAAKLRAVRTELSALIKAYEAGK
ncbi:hypothetical protein [Cypionkella sp.]|uniref:hypothetical protein n=1 Tax=Cypionkella sp. TaxID=2811411 RepID=UPI002AC9DA0E|nr:hypothetical protein [Cypionkella sp.]